MKRTLYLFIFLLLLINCSCNAENQSEHYLSDKRIFKEISGSQIDTFYIKMDKNRFIFASIFQISIDVSVSVLDPQNKIIKEIDNLKRGPEYISFTSSQEGVYKFLVKPFNPMAQTGNYDIGIEKNIKTNNTKDELVKQLFAEFDNDYRAGAAVAIVNNGNVIYKNGFGISDFDSKLKINHLTKLNICSNGKQFTAFAIALLEQKGRLSIDDDIHKYLPEIPEFNTKITISNLLNHSSGLREIADILEISGKRSNGDFTKQDVMKLILRQKELNFRPGSEYLYCNTGYILLAEIIERITNKPYVEWIKENIFLPLGMNDTYFYYDPDHFTNGFAWSYSIGDNGNYKKEQMYKVWYVGAGNIFSTVDDMSKWLMNFDNPIVGNKKTISRLRENQISTDKDNKNFYTFGRVFSNYKGLDYFWHGGGGYGYTSQTIYFPEYKFGAVILSNFIYGGVYGRARQIADIYLNDKFTNREPVYFEYNNPYRPVKVNDKILNEAAGKYLDDSCTITSISKDWNGLFYQSGGSDKEELYALSDSVFFIKEADLRIYLFRDNTGKVKEIKSCKQGNVSFSKRVDNSVEVPINLKIYEGKYYSQELNTFYTIHSYGNTLIAQHDINGAIILIPIKTNSFKGNRWYFSLIDFASSNSKEINEFKITNERVRNIIFRKVIE